MKSKTVKKTLIYSVSTLLLAGALLAAYIYVTQQQTVQATPLEDAAVQTEAEAENRLTKIKVVEIFPLPFTDTLALPGTVTAHREIELASKMAGVVKWIGPQEGSRVKEGAKLMQLDVKSFEASATEAQARYEQALRDFTRTERLYREQIMSQREYDHAKTQLETAKAALDVATFDVDDGTLSSPISGVLDRLNVDPGEYINPGQTVMTIVDIDRVDVELPVPEKDILYFEKGQKVKLSMFKSDREECKGSAELAEQPGCRVFEGTIDFISLSADNSARTYTLKVGVDNSKRVLRPGMIVRAHLVRRRMEDAIAVPFFTILDSESGKSVFVVEDGIARKKPIKYGVFQKGLVEIRYGLEPGEQLIIDGQHNLVDGQKVNVTADVTPLARQWIQEGGELAELSKDIL